MTKRDDSYLKTIRVVATNAVDDDSVISCAVCKMGVDECLVLQPVS